MNLPTPGRFARIATIATLVAVAGVVGTNVAASRAQEAPARWRPLLMAAASDVRPAPPPALGTPEDRAELDEIVAIQSLGSVAEAEIAYWTRGPSVARWNEILLETVRLAKTNPVRTARALALLNAAMYDAVIAACDAKLIHRRASPSERDDRIRALAPLDDLSSFASADAAIAAAAVAVLSAIYPGRAVDYEARARDLVRVRLAAGTHTASDLAAGTAIGEAIGALAVARAAGDGSSAIWAGEVPADAGKWKPVRALQTVQPIEPTAGTWQPWLMASGSQFRPAPPPLPGSPELEAEIAVVRAAAATLSDTEVGIARFWNDGPGTDTPPGHWMRIAIGLAEEERRSLPETARALAHLAIAQADAFIACWDAKFTYWSARPIELIPGFGSTIITPHFPGYISGHSTVSGASATVLAAFFPSAAASLRSQAEEAAISRLYGGIHLPVDNSTGLAVGNRIGALAVERAARDGGMP
jgi:membrane-associated phospholipid phosphatase